MGDKRREGGGLIITEKEGKKRRNGLGKGLKEVR